MECLISFCDNGCSRVSSIYLNIKFQSTLPYGERPAGLDDRQPYTLVSIHAPVWGATENGYELMSSIKFQSTLPYGERPSPGFPMYSASSCFNPRSRMGSDYAGIREDSGRDSFNPRSRMGSDSLKVIKPSLS